MSLKLSPRLSFLQTLKIHNSQTNSPNKLKFAAMVLAEQLNKLIKYFQNQLITFVNIGLQSRPRIQKSVQGAPLSEVASFKKK